MNYRGFKRKQHLEVWSLLPLSLSSFTSPSLFFFLLSSASSSSPSISLLVWSGCLEISTEELLILNLCDVGYLCSSLKLDEVRINQGSSLELSFKREFSLALSRLAYLSGRSRSMGFRE